ncbi:putative LRR receptor-like protein kinase [Trifolium pratense]|uniref:non-specific serine/threonine protein kinase n=1 Tax=Trifolium pratense TaxID=57577 RepID=A0A2K3N0R2_TRIPR|nr:putative LRR receptor-like protein kinase [Trifolium pratense]
MRSLQSVDFSYNHLSGLIPTGGVFQTETAEAFAGNSGMIGFGILLFQRKAKKLSEESKSNEDNDQSISMVWGRDAKFTFSDLVKATNDFNEKYCIGKAGFGSVYKAELVPH